MDYNYLSVRYLIKRTDFDGKKGKSDRREHNAGQIGRFGFRKLRTESFMNITIIKVAK